MGSVLTNDQVGVAHIGERQRMGADGWMGKAKTDDVLVETEEVRADACGIANGSTNLGHDSA